MNMAKMDSMALVLAVTVLAHLAVCAYGFSSGLYVDNGFRQTVLVSDLPHNHKKAIKQQILDLLGLHRRPKPTKTGNTNSAPHYMLDLYWTLEEEADYVEDETERVKESVRRKRLTLPGMEREVGEADMITSFVNHAHRNKQRIRHGGHRRFYFDMAEVPEDQALTGAELRMYKQPTSGNTTLRIDIYRLTSPDDNGGRELELEATSLVAPSSDGWLEFNVTHPASIWTRRHRDNLGLYMIITDAEGDDVEPRHAGLVTSKGPAEKQTFMVAFFKATQDVTFQHTRTRRSASSEGMSYKDESPYDWTYQPTHERFSGRSCQRRSLYVDFKDLKWEEWIIAPGGYSAFYCHGECSFPLNAHMNATNHAIVQTLVHLLNPLMVPKPSCAPTKLTAISVLYFDDNSNVILKKYRNMVVRACGCH